jgi:hypothetical protein
MVSKLILDVFFSEKLRICRERKKEEIKKKEKRKKEKKLQYLISLPSSSQVKKLIMSLFLAFPFIKCSKSLNRWLSLIY